MRFLLMSLWEWGRGGRPDMIINITQTHTPPNLKFEELAGIQMLVHMSRLCLACSQLRWYVDTHIHTFYTPQRILTKSGERPRPLNWRTLF